MSTPSGAPITSHPLPEPYRVSYTLGEGPIHLDLGEVRTVARTVGGVEVAARSGLGPDLAARRIEVELVILDAYAVALLDRIEVVHLGFTGCPSPLPTTWSTCAAPAPTPWTRDE